MSHNFGHGSHRSARYMLPVSSALFVRATSEGARLAFASVSSFGKSKLRYVRQSVQPFCTSLHAIELGRIGCTSSGIVLSLTRNEGVALDDNRH